MPVIRAIAFSFWNPNLREIKRMPFGQVERFLFAPERDRNVFDEFVEFALGRLAFVFRDVVEIHFAHEGNSSRRSARREELTVDASLCRMELGLAISWASRPVNRVIRAYAERTRLVRAKLLLLPSFRFHLLELAAVSARQATQHVRFVGFFFAVQIINDVEMRLFWQLFLSIFRHFVNLLRRNRFQSSARLRSGRVAVGQHVNRFRLERERFRERVIMPRSAGLSLLGLAVL